MDGEIKRDGTHLCRAIRIGWSGELLREGHSGPSLSWSSRCRHYLGFLFLLRFANERDDHTCDVPHGCFGSFAIRFENVIEL